VSRPLIIIGAGGHAKVLINALRDCGADIIGALDADPGLHGSEVLGVAVLGDDTAISGHAPGGVYLVNGIGSVSRPDARKAAFERFTGKGYEFAGVTHPSAVVARDVAVGPGSQIMAGCVVQPGAVIGADCIINTRAGIDHDSTIGDHVHIAPGATLCGNVRVGDCSHVGSGATVIQNAVIGAGCVVAAGATVVGNVAGGTTVFGNPARPK